MTELTDLDVWRIVDYLQQQRAGMVELLQRLVLTESSSEDPTGLGHFGDLSRGAQIIRNVSAPPAWARFGRSRVRPPTSAPGERPFPIAHRPLRYGLATRDTRHHADAR